MQGCPPPTHPPPHRPHSRPHPRSHRGAAGRLSGGTHCWYGTVCCTAARVRWTTWDARLGVRPSASTRRVIGRAAALARRGRATLATISWSSGRRSGTPTYEVLEALCGCACTSTVAALARCRARTPHASPPRRRACCVSTFLDS